MDCSTIRRSSSGINHAANERMDLPNPQRDLQTYSIIGAAMAVHTELKRGFLEAVYRHALAFELGTRSIPFAREVDLTITYKGRPLPVSYRADFVCYSDVIVEIKAAADLSQADVAQVINYPRAARIRRGLLINFGGPSLQYRRLVWGDP
jgi:GxxExxY protein